MSEEFSFLNEKIKDKPFYKRKWVKILISTVVLAAIFGVVSCTVFIKMYAWTESKQEQEEIKDIEIPQDFQEEVQQAEEDAPEETQSQTEPIVVEAELTLENISKLYDETRALTAQACKSLVTVTAVRSDVDWFNEAYENSGQSTGMIIDDNGVELLIVTSYATVEACDGINVTFADNSVTAAVLKKYDVTTDMAVISVNLSEIPEETNKVISQAKLGNSVRLEAGEPVIAIGRADGSDHSMKIGALTSVHNSQSVVDAEYTLLVTDMVRNAGADGVLVNLEGQVVGIIQNQHLSANTQNVLSAYAISDIKSLLEHLSNNQDVTYLGIKGVSVTSEAQKTGVPSGVYVTEVEMDSPAMRGGIQTGDVIQTINGHKVTGMTELSNVLQRLSNKQNITLEGQRLTKAGYKKINYQTSLSVLE